ncbi:MAG: TatD family hydrolase [Candidatus Hydrogenedentota bacterium]
MTALVDTHCHLQDSRFEEDRSEVLDRSLDVLDWLVVVGDDVDTSRQAIEMTRNRVFATVGIHPYHADRADQDALTELRRLAALEGTVAIGEIGLDYYRYAETTPAEQHQAFEAQLELAADLALPVVIHNRDADEDAAAILANAAGRIPGVIMHCFGSNAAFAETCLEMGAYLSFAGNVTFPKAGSLREAAGVVPMDRLLVETDSPYLAPQPVRGKRCEPRYVQYTAACLAEVKGVTIEVFAQRTGANAARLFRVGEKVPPT